jgi:hypothetical protein
MSILIELQATIADLVVKGKGIRVNRRKPPRLSLIATDDAGARRIYQWRYPV